MVHYYSHSSTLLNHSADINEVVAIAPSLVCTPNLSVTTRAPIHNLTKGTSDLLAKHKVNSSSVSRRKK